jgi:hypothetical protein
LYGRCAKGKFERVDVVVVWKVEYGESAVVTDSSPITGVGSFFFGFESADADTSLIGDYVCLVTGAFFEIGYRSYADIFCFGMALLVSYILLVCCGT